jgi:PASTA domain
MQRGQSGGSGETTHAHDRSTVRLPLAATTPDRDSPAGTATAAGRDFRPWLVVLILVIAALVGAGLAAWRNGSDRAAGTTTATPVQALVPGVVGFQAPAALAALRVHGLRGNVVTVPSSMAAGRVVAQHPKAGAAVHSGSIVRLNVSRRPAPPSNRATSTAPAPPAAAIAVPDVRGEKVDDARKELRRAGLVIDLERVPGDQPKNTVVLQSPGPGTSVTRGQHIVVTLSFGRHGGRHGQGNQGDEDRG